MKALIDSQVIREIIQDHKAVVFELKLSRNRWKVYSYFLFGIMIVYTIILIISVSKG